jgi:hypothetical protein
MVGLVAPHLRVERHYRDALRTLTAAKSEAAEAALTASLRRCFDDDLAIYLLNQTRSTTAVAPIVREMLESGGQHERTYLMTKVILGVEDARTLEYVIDEAVAKNLLYEIAFGPTEGKIWDVGSQAAAIRRLVRFDVDAAWEAARAVIENPAGRDRERYPELFADIDPTAAVPLLLDRLRVETDKRVQWAIGRALVQIAKQPGASLTERITEWLTSADSERRRTACEAMGWLYSVYGSDNQSLQGRLDDVDERVATAAHAALARLQGMTYALEIAHAIASESQDDRRWRLLDAVISLADPGELHHEAPELYRQVGPILPFAMRDHLVRGLKRRRDELVNEAKRGE